MRKFFFASIIIPGFAALFGGGSLIKGFKLWWFTTTSLFGGYLAFACLPMFDSKAWKERPGWFAFLGCLALGAVGYARGATPDMVFGLGVLGAILGCFAPYWGRYVNLP